MSALSFRPRHLWRQFRESSSSAGRLVLYIQIVTVVLILGSVISIETLSWFAGQRLKDRLSGILLQEDQVAYLTVRLGEIARIKEEFLLDSDQDDASTREMVADLQIQLASLSSEFHDRTLKRIEQNLPLLILKEFDSAHLRILRAERVVSSALRVNRALTRRDGLDLLKQYPLTDLRLVQQNLLGSYQDLNLLAMEVENELEQSDEFYELILAFTLLGASSVAMVSSYRVYQRAIVKPLEAISAVAGDVPIVDTVGDTADHLASLQNAATALAGSIHGAREIKTLRHTMAALLSRLVMSCETLNELSMTDPLCQVGNRRALEVYGDKAWQQASRSASPIGLMMLDVDHFKQFNDRYGHAKGDQVLSALSSCMARWTRRPLDDVFRYGGEEFLALMYDVSPEKFEACCEDIRASVQELAIEHQDATAGIVTISGGALYVSSPHNISIHDAIQEADQELYRAKKLGRNCVSIRRYGQPVDQSPI